jgi:Zn-dependent peptidase ImmA (M78 family)
MSDAPDKLSAFINAIINIGRNYNMSVENFHHAAMRSYQEMHNNYFENLEEEAAIFRKKYGSNNQLKELREILAKDFDIKVKIFKSDEYPVLVNMRSIFKPNTKDLLIHENTSEIQQTYTIAKEIGFQFMNLTPRALSSQSVDSKTFEEVLNSFKASYFAGALLLPKEEFKSDIEKWLSELTWDPSHIETLLEKYNCTPETFFYRLTGILANFFGIDTLFFMRFESVSGSNEYWLTKEMHLARRLGPQEKIHEHYCRRWVSIDILDNLAYKQNIGSYSKPLIDCQISTMKENSSTYFVMSIARPLNITKNKNESVNIGFELTEEIKSKIGFIQDDKINKMLVNQTCERCSIFDCQQRQTAPVVLQAKRQRQEIKKLLNKLT